MCCVELWLMPLKNTRILITFVIKARGRLYVHTSKYFNRKFSTGSMASRSKKLKEVTHNKSYSNSKEPLLKWTLDVLCIRPKNINRISLYNSILECGR